MPGPWRRLAASATAMTGGVAGSAHSAAIRSMSAGGSGSMRSQPDETHVIGGGDHDGSARQRSVGFAIDGDRTIQPQFDASCALAVVHLGIEGVAAPALAHFGRR